ncbi:MAG TPA: hypothetical protein VHE61_01260, partial [Opitutaceae bacterium]|nr:hypothetical protein [Opitutaceae bacterium]
PEKPNPRGFLRSTADSAAEILPLHATDPLSPSAVEAYFHLHYWRHEDQTDANRILECFPPVQNEASLLGLRFKDCGERFRFIESAYQSVLVPYGPGRELIAELRATFDPAGQRRLARRLQRYVVQIPEAVALAHRGRGLTLLHDHFLVLDDDLAYSDELGLQLSDDRIYDPEKLTA